MNDTSSSLRYYNKIDVEVNRAAIQHQCNLGEIREKYGAEPKDLSEEEVDQFIERYFE